MRNTWSMIECRILPGMRCLRLRVACVGQMVLRRVWLWGRRIGIQGREEDEEERRRVESYTVKL